jgi:hypothetical protein
MKKFRDQKKNSLSRPKKKKKSLRASIKTGSAQLSAYFRSYVHKDGGEYHSSIFRILKAMLNPQKVLYPGCHRHITPSLFFSTVDYIDCDPKVGKLYTDPKALAYVEENKEYKEETVINFDCKDFNANIGFAGSYDLLISLSAGFVSTPCERYLKEKGYLFVNDAHSDASTAYLNENFKLVGMYDRTKEKFDDDSAILAGCFHTKDGKKLTKAHVEKGAKDAKFKRSLGLLSESMFYLFQKNTGNVEDSTKKRKRKANARSSKP